MKEGDYSRVGNLKSVRVMLHIVRNMDSGRGCGVTDIELNKLMTLLGGIERRLAQLVSSRAAPPQEDAT